jgi:hypothetical protein
MKTRILTSLIVLMVMSLTTVAQTIRRVNNNPGVTGATIYLTIQAAHDAAEDGDIVYLEASNATYGSLNCTKRLKIYGGGFFLDKNLDLQVDIRSSKVDNIYLRLGSDGTEVAGLELLGGVAGYGVSDITIVRNKARYIGFMANIEGNTYSNFSDITIRQNFISSPGNNGYGFGILTFDGGSYASVDYYGSNIMIVNNFIGGDGGNTSIKMANRVTNMVLKNNTITGAILVANGVVENNILLKESLFAPGNDYYNNSADNCTFNNNVGKGNTFPANFPATNQNNIDGSAHFDVVAGKSDDFNLRLKESSALKTAGSGGTEVGMFGGDFPFVIGGIPSVPTITVFNSTAVGSEVTPLSVSISTKANH